MHEREYTAFSIEKSVNKEYLYMRTPESSSALWGIARNQMRRQDGGKMWLLVDGKKIPLCYNLVAAYSQVDPFEKHAIRTAITEEMKSSKYLIVERPLRHEPFSDYINNELSELENF